MAQKRDEWQFVRLRASQLYEEGDIAGALRLLEEIHRVQLTLLEEDTEYEQTENC